MSVVEIFQIAQSKPVARAAFSAVSSEVKRLSSMEEDGKLTSVTMKAISVTLRFVFIIVITYHGANLMSTEKMEPPAGFEPTPPQYESGILLLNYGGDSLRLRSDKVLKLKLFDFLICERIRLSRCLLVVNFLEKLLLFRIGHTHSFNECLNHLFLQLLKLAPPERVELPCVQLPFLLLRRQRGYEGN
jgi:hypothetical protein